MQPRHPMQFEVVIPIAAKERRLGNLKNDLRKMCERMYPFTAVGNVKSNCYDMRLV